MNLVTILLISVLTYSSANEVCKDDPAYAYRCRIYASIEGYCKYQEDYMRKNCPKSCGFCSKASNCDSRPGGSRIVGGSQAPKGSWPWMAMLAWAGGPHFCGGALIHPQWVLTAAHCIQYGAESGLRTVVRMGAYRIDDIGQEREVEEIIMHENYDSYTFNYDIALLKLSTPVILGDGVGLVCLPDESIDLLPGKTCDITGWGYTKENGSNADNLQQASVAIVSQVDCEDAYAELNNIYDSMICAGFIDQGGVDACTYDSGGPMVCEFNGKWYLEGVISWGNGCAKPGSPGAYANVRFLKTWILNQISSE